MCRKLRIHEYAPLIEALHKRFGTWQLRNISYAGRLQLLKSVIASLINFWGTAFCFPKGCVKKIEQLCKRFLWSGKAEENCSHKVAWSVVCTSKEEGGLGLRNLLTWNKTLLLKLAWRLQTSTDSLWADWMKHHYLTTDWIWIANPKASDSWVWKAILSLRPLIKTFMHSRVNNGRDTSFWFDNWANGLTFFDICGESGCMKLGLSKNASVADAEESGVWDKLQSGRAFRDRNIAVLQEALQHQRRPSSTQERDDWSWSRETGVHRVFSTRYTWGELEGVGEKPRWAKLIWFRGAVPKHAFIFWLSVLDRIPSLQRLSSWGCVANSLCPRCQREVESRDHIFLGCVIGEVIWVQVTKRLGGASFLINDWDSLISWLLTGTPGVSKTLSRLAVQATLYHIWRMRNLVLYQQKSIPAETIFKHIDRSIRDTILAKRRRRVFANLLQQWFRWE